MKLSKRKLNQIIQEEYERMLQEQETRIVPVESRLGARHVGRGMMPDLRTDPDIVPVETRGEALRLGMDPNADDTPSTYPDGTPVPLRRGPTRGHIGDVKAYFSGTPEEAQKSAWRARLPNTRTNLEEKLARQIERYIYENLKG